MLYSTVETCDYKSAAGEPREFELKIPKNISEILWDKYADCDIFATVIDTGNVNKDIFNCQVLWPPNEDPRLLIYCIQQKFRERQCNLKIGWMVVGYDVNFNLNAEFKVHVLKNDFKQSNSQYIIQSLNFIGI